METSYRVTDISEWPVAGPEPAGQDEKLWLLDPATDHEWLFKPSRMTPTWPAGQVWTEKLASELAALIEVPAAVVELAQRERTAEDVHVVDTKTSADGCISKNACPPDWEHQTGAALLTTIASDFDSKDRERKHHSLENIADVLQSYCSPPDPNSNEMTAFDNFTGYLLLDAWIANQDRHAENWSVIRGPRGERCLMASYDHASSFGFQLLDTKREAVLAGNPGIEAWASRGRARTFEGGKQTTLVEHLSHGFVLAEERARLHWLERLHGVDWSHVEKAIDRLPIVSPVARAFCLELLTVNRRRILQCT